MVCTYWLPLLDFNLTLELCSVEIECFTSLNDTKIPDFKFSFWVSLKYF